MLVAYPWVLFAILALVTDDWKERLESGSAVERGRALRELSADPQAASKHIDLLLELLEHRMLRGEAARCLSKVLEHAPDDIEKLRAPYLRAGESASMMLASILKDRVSPKGGAAYEILLEGLASTNTACVRGSLNALSSLGHKSDELAPQFIERLPDPVHCHAAAAAILRTLFEPNELASAVESNLLAKNDDVRMVAVFLSQVVAAEFETLPRGLTDGLKHKDPWMRATTLTSLAAFGDRMRPHSQAILSLMGDRDRGVRSRLATILPELGPSTLLEDPKILKKANRMIRNSDSSLRVRYCLALLSLEPEREDVVKAIEKAFRQEEDPRTRARIFSILSESESWSDGLVALVLQGLEDDHKRVRVQAVQSAQACPLPSDALNQALVDRLSENSLAALVLQALHRRQCLPEEAPSRLLELLDRESSSQAAWQLAPHLLAYEEVEPHLHALLEKREAYARLLGGKTLIAYGIRSKEALDAVIDGLDAQLGGFGGFGAPSSHPMRKLSSALQERKQTPPAYEALSLLLEFGIEAKAARPKIETLRESNLYPQVRRQAQQILDWLDSLEAK